MAPQYNRKGVFDFMGLPPELREMIYNYVLSDIDLEPKALLMNKGPRKGVGLRYTSRFILHESTKTYLPHQIRVCHARSEYLDYMLEYIRFMASEPVGDEESEVRTLLYNITRLAHSAHGGYLEYKCKHKCQEFDSYYCDCAEHNNCFRCGRWLAMALYYELQQEKLCPSQKHVRRAPDLAHAKGKDFYMTELGNQVRDHTRNQARNPISADSREFLWFGEYGSQWWTKELAKQVYRALHDGSRCWYKEEGHLRACDMELLVAMDKVMERRYHTAPETWHKDAKVKHFASLSQPMDEAIVKILGAGLKIVGGPVVLYRRVKGWFSKKKGRTIKMEKVE